MDMYIITPDNLQILINERNRFEDQLYDYLLSESIPASFWEPITVCYEKTKDLEDVIGEESCIICMETHINFKKLHCCKQKLCNGCSYKWFETSVKCPYCYQDIREFDIKNN
jgi:hypothetical protein